MKSEINKQMIDCLIMSADNINVTFLYFFLSGEVSRHYIFFCLVTSAETIYIFFCLVTSADTIYIFFVW